MRGDGKRERERERDRQIDRQRERERERDGVQYTARARGGENSAARGAASERPVRRAAHIAACDAGAHDHIAAAAVRV